MTWYPDGDGDGDGDGAGKGETPPPPPAQASPVTTGQTVITTADDLPTVARPGLRRGTPRRDPAAADDDDAPTVARPSLARRPPFDGDTFDDDDPTVKHKRLRRAKPRVELLDDRYQLVKQIGTGGMGEVWQGRHVRLARDVAIKFLTNEEGGPRFELEAQAIASMRHSGVVHVLDFGETKQGVPYFVMELIEGETLIGRVRRTGPLSWALVRNIALELSDALAHAHEHGLVHRDLKPSNVIVLDSPPPRGSSTKLIDFGIAKRIDDDSASNKLTQEGFVQGTPAYMSPEQVLGEEVDARTDVYGLGCLLYFLLCAHRPFADKSGTAALRAQLDELPPRFAEVVPGQPIPPQVEELVFHAIAKDKGARFESMKAMQAAIMAIPPDASASMSARVPSKGPKSASPLTTTASYSASYSASHEAMNTADAGSSSAGSSSATLGSSAASSPIAAGPRQEPPASSSRRDTILLTLAIVAALSLIGAAIVGLIWAVTSSP